MIIIAITVSFFVGLWLGWKLHRELAATITEGLKPIDALREELEHRK